jgi:hypothetical protein
MLVLLLLGALVALVISASLAVALPVAGALLLLGLVRSAWYRLTGRRPRPLHLGATFRGVQVGPGRGGAPGTAPADDEGPVVDALPRAPRENDRGGG